jgi:heme exporter protein B
MRAALHLAAKDLKVELRSKEMVSSMFLFSLLIVLAFRFAFGEDVDTDPGRMNDLAASALWICFTFATIVGMHTSFAKEKDRETLEGLLLCPIDRSEIFLGKVLSNLVIVFFVEAVSILFFALFFSYDYGGNVVSVVLVTLVGTAGLVLVGTLVAAIAVNGRAREALLPILLIPLIAFSVIIPCVSATKKAVSGDLGDSMGELESIVGFAVIFGAIGYFSIEYVLEG